MNLPFFPPIIIQVPPIVKAPETHEANGDIPQGATLESGTGEDIKGGTLGNVPKSPSPKIFPSDLIMDIISANLT
jgi:hypothetical protein